MGHGYLKATSALKSCKGNDSRLIAVKYLLMGACGIDPLEILMKRLKAQFYCFPVKRKLQNKSPELGPFS